MGHNNKLNGRLGVINTYREYLPVTDSTPVVTLHEGNTPLIKADNLAKKICPQLDIYLKYEGLNPTGSFKDRGITMAVTKAFEAGAKTVMCASTGNTSAAAAAYAARCGMKCIVLIPEGKIALGKLAQAIIYNAKVIQIRGNFDQALKQVRHITENYPVTIVNSINPYRIEGQKTASFEVVDVLGDAPVYHTVSVGNGMNITSYWHGYKEYKSLGKSTILPKMLGFQAAGASPLVSGKVVEKPETIATAIRIGNPATWDRAIQTRDESGGLIDSVTDEEILEAYRMLAKYEGVFAEPSSTAAIAGVIKKAKEGYFGPEKASIVCTLTGHGLKDPDSVTNYVTPPVTVDNVCESIVKEAGLI